MRAVFVVSTVLLVAILVRVVLLQTVQSDGLLKAAHSQRVTERVLRARRGAIYASNGTALAVSAMAPTFFANPKLVKGAPVAAAALARALKLSDAKEAALRTALADHSKSFVYVARQVDGQPPQPSTRSSSPVRPATTSRGAPTRPVTWPTASSA